VRDRQDYEDLLSAIGVCMAARIPFLLWGEPGCGKTAVLESATLSGWHVETLIVSHHEASDFAGLPVVSDRGTVTLAPPQWATRLAECGRPSLAFFDEWTTASPSVQAAALRPLTHHEVGALQLPDTVSFGAAANPADVAAGGWELAPPTANRFCHLDWSMPLDVYTEAVVTDHWPTLPVHGPSPRYAEALAQWRAVLAGYLRARQTQLSALPQDAASRGRAFPTPRTWSYATTLAATAASLGLRKEVVRLLVYGCVGAPAGHEFLVWAEAQDLPDPEKVLADPTSVDFASLRADRQYVVLQSVLAAVVREPTPERWSAAVEVCALAAGHDGLDAAVPVVRALVRPDVRPAGTPVPPAIKVFAGALALAGLLPGSP
jgi:MoxR-like ATPase